MSLPVCTADAQILDQFKPRVLFPQNTTTNNNKFQHDNEFLKEKFANVNVICTSQE